MSYWSPAFVLSIRSIAQHVRDHKGDAELADIIDGAADEIVRLNNLLHAPLTEAELKLVDKNCDWQAFRHAWNAIIKHRLAAIRVLPAAVENAQVVGGR